MAAEAGFKSVDTSLGHAIKDDVESPSLSSSNVLARFEFEPGKSKSGTKILMVEWEDDATTRDLQDDWEISWEDKRHVLPARDITEDGETTVNRLYFLLGAGVPVPTAVHLQRGSIAWRTNPLPAIFSPELGATARQAGKRGVLHTIWAKKRLQVLQKEIDSEAKENAEGIGYEMAIAEKEWIQQNFGVQSRSNGLSITTTGIPTTAGLRSPTSPRTPGGGRLMEKLKGLRLGTSEKDLSRAESEPAAWHNPLSPEGSDIAVSGFSSFAALKGGPSLASLAAMPAQPPQRRIVAQMPPDSFAAQQRQATESGSLNALAAPRFTSPPAVVGDDKDEEDLFALPMSPRSPEMSKSPFSFGSRGRT